MVGRGWAELKTPESELEGVSTPVACPCNVETGSVSVARLMGKVRSWLAVAILASCMAGFTAVPAQASAPRGVGFWEPDAALTDPVVAPASGTPAERLAQLNDQFERATADIERLNVQLAADQRREAAVTISLTGFARLQYEQPGPILRLLSAGSLSQVMGDIAQDRLVADRERALLQESRSLKVRDRKARDEAVAKQAQIRAGRDEAQAIADQAAADEALRAQAQALADAEAAAAARSRSAYLAPPAPSTRSTQASVPVATSGPNRFAYGYCTWYVANRRYIPWLGNAADWWPNARPYGFAEGQVPRVGAIMVTWESGYGHVAYVESVNANGSWTVSEMNFVGWNVISSRTIRPGQVPLIGFIY